MINKDKLSALVADIARTPITEFPVEDVLGAFVERVVEVLPVTAAGVTLISAGTAPHFMAASDQSALRGVRPGMPELRSVLRSASRR